MGTHRRTRGRPPLPVVAVLALDQADWEAWAVGNGYTIRDAEPGPTLAEPRRAADRPDRRAIRITGHTDAVTAHGMELVETEGFSERPDAEELRELVGRFIRPAR